MASGKTYWWAMDAAWLDREHIVELGETWGPAGPLVIVALCGMAKLENDAGRVLTGYRSLARRAFSEAEAVQAIVAQATSLGVLDDLDEFEDGRRFSCRISGWVADQEKGRSADRKARQRKSRGVTPSPAKSRPVTGSHAPVGDRTAQDRTEQIRDRGRGTRPTQPTGHVDNAGVEQPNLSVVDGRGGVA